MTALASSERPPRLADRIAARAFVLSLDPHTAIDRIADAVVTLAHDNARIIEQAARRVRFDVPERPSPAARRAVAALDAARARLADPASMPEQVVRSTG